MPFLINKVLESILSAKAMKISLALFSIIAAIWLFGFHTSYGCFSSMEQTPRRFCKKDRTWKETTSCVIEEELKEGLENLDECVTTCIRAEPAYSFIEPCIFLGFFTIGFGEHAPFGLHNFLTRPYMEYTAAFLESFGESLIGLCEGIEIAGLGLDRCTNLCGDSKSGNKTKEAETRDKLKKIIEILDALEITLETSYSMNEDGSEVKKLEADITDQIKYNDLMIQTHLMTKLFAKAESGKKLFTQILMKKAEGKHGVHWILWMWDELIRDLVQRRPDVYCPKVPAYLIKQLRMRNVATFVKIRQISTADDLQSELDNLKKEFKKTQDSQDEVIKQSCIEKKK